MFKLFYKTKNESNITITNEPYYRLIADTYINAIKEIHLIINKINLYGIEHYEEYDNIYIHTNEKIIVIKYIFIKLNLSLLNIFNEYKNFIFKKENALIYIIDGIENMYCIKKDFIFHEYYIGNELKETCLNIIKKEIEDLEIVKNKLYSLFE
jgi:hypothetical protein